MPGRAEGLDPRRPAPELVERYRFARNALVARELIDAGFNRGDLTVLERLVEPAFVEHQRLPPGIPPTIDALRAIIGAL